MVPKTVKRKPEDELPLPNIAVKKAKASSAVAGDHGDDDGLQYSRSKWMDDSMRLSSDNLSEVSPEKPVEEVEEVEVSKENPVEEVEEVQQGGNDTTEEGQAYLDSEDHFKKQSIAIPDESNQTWESKQASNTKLDIYPLNAAVQVQKDLEKLESEMVIRDRIPWVCNLSRYWSLDTLFCIQFAHTWLMPSWCRRVSNGSYVAIAKQL